MVERDSIRLEDIVGKGSMYEHITRQISSGDVRLILEVDGMVEKRYGVYTDLEGNTIGTGMLYVFQDGRNGKFVYFGPTVFDD